MLLALTCIGTSEDTVRQMQHNHSVSILMSSPVAREFVPTFCACFVFDVTSY